MDIFLVNENVRHFRELLARELDPARRRMVESLLAQEEAKRAELAAPAPPAAPPPTPERLRPPRTRTGAAAAGAPADPSG